MLYLIGLGLWDESDISLRAIDALKKCDEVYLETYTNKWLGSVRHLEEIIGKEGKHPKPNTFENQIL